MEDNQLVITTEPRTFKFNNSNLPTDAGINFKHDINLKHDIYSIIKGNELLAEHKIKKEM